MKALVIISVVVVSVLGVIGVYKSFQADAMAVPVVATASQ